MEFLFSIFSRFGIGAGLGLAGGQVGWDRAPTQGGREGGCDTCERHNCSQGKRGKGKGKDDSTRRRGLAWHSGVRLASICHLGHLIIIIIIITITITQFLCALCSSFSRAGLDLFHQCSMGNEVEVASEDMYLAYSNGSE